MKRKLIFSAALALLLFAALCVSVGAVGSCNECEHTPEWTVETDASSALGGAYSIQICSQCGLVLCEEDLAPIIVSKGFSYFNGSIVQGYYISTSNLEEFEARSGKTVDYGVVASVQSISGTKPLGEDMELTEDNVIAINLKNLGSEHFEIKVTGISDDSMDVKIILCAYIVIDGEIYYVDNGAIDGAVAGVTYNEVIAYFEKGAMPEGLYTHRKLTVEEMGITTDAFWWSNASSSIVANDSGNKTYIYSCTRMFTKEELPAGSYVMVKSGLKYRPELWNANKDKNGSRPFDNMSASRFDITESVWDKGGDDVFQYLAFNISGKDADVDFTGARPEDICDMFEIYVPAGTKVQSTEVDSSGNVSVEGLKLLDAETLEIKQNYYWNSQSSTSIIRGKSEYFATRKFTQEELPVGTVIEVSVGWFYRPERWKNDTTSSARPNNMATYRFVVTEEFWSEADNSTYRAFNITTYTKTKYTSEDVDLAAAAFKIYVPETSTLY